MRARLQRLLRRRRAELGLALLVAFLAAGGWAAAQSGPANLLVNGDFEAWDWGINSWPLQDGISEVQVCPGWRAFYVDDPPPNVAAAEYWKRPEFRDVKSSQYPDRVHGGFLAQKYFTFGGQHIAGLYQQVGDIPPGTPLRFSAYMQTWSCMAGDGEWNECPTGTKSHNPAPMHTRIGLDPTGGTNPWSPAVVWSPEINAYDAWVLFQVEATARAGTVTVFTYSYADWYDSIFRIHNDVYIDDASLIALNEVPTVPTPTPGSSITQDPAGPTPTPRSTATPAPSATPSPTATATATPTATAMSEPTTAVAAVTSEPPTLTASPVPVASAAAADVTALTWLLLGGIGTAIVVLLVMLGFLLADLVRKMR